jgi:hypothetical protein
VSIKFVNDMVRLKHKDRRVEAEAAGQSRPRQAD